LHCNTLQHTATHCNTLQHTATHCNQHTATHTATNKLHRTATHCNQHTATHFIHVGHPHTLCVCRDGERRRNRETERQRDRETEKQRDRETEVLCLYETRPNYTRPHAFPWVMTHSHERAVCCSVLQCVAVCCSDAFIHMRELETQRDK